MEKNRPTIITVVCILWGIGTVIFFIPILFFASIGGVGYLPYFALSSFAGLIGIIGLLKIKKWGIFSFTLIFIFDQLIILKMGGINMLGIIISLAVIGVGFSQYSKLR